MNAFSWFQIWSYWSFFHNIFNVGKASAISFDLKKMKLMLTHSYLVTLGTFMPQRLNF